MRDSCVQTPSHRMRDDGYEYQRCFGSNFTRYDPPTLNAKTDQRNNNPGNDAQLGVVAGPSQNAGFPNVVKGSIATQNPAQHDVPIEGYIPKQIRQMLPITFTKH